MGIYLIKDGVSGEVRNRIVADPEFVAELVESDPSILVELAPAKAPTIDDVNRERDRRLEADFLFNGVWFQRDQKSLARITGAATLAGFAMGQGAQTGNYRWANPARDFAWIASDNSLNLMDAQTAFAFGQAAANIETSIIFAAKLLREMDPIPDDYQEDIYWP